MPEPLAVISDVHANAEALEAVLSDIRGLGVRRIACLGDLMGYGPDPEKVVDMVAGACELVVAGNHDWGVLKRPIPFHAHAAELIRVHQCRMTPAFFNFLGRRRVRWKFLDKLDSLAEMDDTLFVHGSVRNHVMEYVYPDNTDHFDRAQIRDLFRKIPRVMFCGHTHLACVIRDDLRCGYATEFLPQFRLVPGRKYIINPGSVGQPRDGDRRAGYCVYFPDRVLFRRVAYDVEETCRKMLQIDGAARMMAGRLMRGE